MRNPVDAIPSYINLFSSCAHSLQPVKPFRETHPKNWDFLVKLVVGVYKNYCRMEMERMQHSLPTYFIRYEDLCTKPVETLSELFCFLLNVKSIEGTVI